MSDAPGLPSDAAPVGPLLSREIANLRQLLETRLDAMDRASIVFSENLNRVPSVLDREISKISVLTDEKFKAIEAHFVLYEGYAADRFSAADLRYQQLYDASDKALAAASLAAQSAVSSALAAAKEAVQAASISAEKAVAAQNESNATSQSKSEAFTVKQIDGLLALVGANNGALSDKIATINARLDRQDGIVANGHTTQASIITIVAVGVAVCSLGFTAFNATGARGSAAGNLSIASPAVVHVNP